MTRATHAAALPFVRAMPHGISAIDTGFHRAAFDAAYLMVEGGRAAFIDAGTNDSVGRLLEALDATGVDPEAVDFVIATHVHLDHAGGIGLLMRHLPRARLVVHALGARHLIDPTGLLQGARAVYGADEVARTYGDVQGVPAERVLRTTDGMEIELAGRPLVFLDTPGHARHHHCVWDARSRGFFTGDTFGISYRELDTPAGPWIMPSTTPVQFEPESLKRSIVCMSEYRPDCAYLTHFGRVDGVARLADMLISQIDAMVDLAVRLPHDDSRHAALVSGLSAIQMRSLREHGSTLDAAVVARCLALDTELNAQGIAVWLNRKNR